MKRQILKALTVLLIISALAGGMAACGKKEKAQVSDGTFTVGFDAEFPPYGYKDELTQDSLNKIADYDMNMNGGGFGGYNGPMNGGYNGPTNNGNGPM